MTSTNTFEKTFCERINKKNTEYLSEDILEEEHMKNFGPYCYVQKILGSCRVDVRDRFVTAPSFWQKAYTIFCVITGTLAFLYLNHTLYNHKFKDDFSLFFMCFCALTLIYVTYLSVIIHARFLNCEDNVKFFIQIQKIDRLMGIENNKKINTFIRIINYASMTFLPIMYIIPCINMWNEDLVVGFGMLGVLYSQSTSAVEIIFCSNTILCFFLRLRFLNSIMRNHLQGDIRDAKMNRIHYPSVKKMRILAANTHDFISSDTDVYLKEIFNAFHNFQQLYRFQILVFYLKHMSISFITFNIVLFIIQHKISELFFFVNVPLITIIDLILSIVLCICYHIFFNEVKSTKRLSTNVMSMHYTGPLREKAKRMWMLIENAPPKFSIYDMWYMDLHLLLKTFNILTTLIITRLQFAL